MQQIKQMRGITGIPRWSNGYESGFHCCGFPGFNPWWQTRLPQAVQCGQKFKKKKKIFKKERYQKNDAIEVQKKPEGLEGLSGGNGVFNR